MSEGMTVVRDMSRDPDPHPEADDRWGSILDHLKEGFQVISHDWRYIYVNEAVARHGRTTRGGLLGRRMGEAYPGIEQTMLFAVLERCMRQRRSADFVNEFVFPDGRSGWFELRIAPVPEGLAILSLDVTAHKQLEAQLAARSAELAASRRMLHEITYAAAHDLQTPLRHVLSFSDPDDTQPGSLEALCRVHEAATLMHERLTALVAYTEAERGETPRLVHLGELIDQALTGLESLVTSTGATLDLDIPEEVVTVAPTALSTAARAFCHNALIYHLPGTPPRIKLEMAVDSEHCTVTVRDQGIGIAEGHLSAIWQAFYRVREAGDFPGLGVGLARARVAVESVGGSVEARSTLGRGSVFVARVPVG